MRKLTVKNFSVIKDAELEFGKITVLIGPQSSGKSLLCKLAYFMGRIALEIAMEQVVRLNDYSQFRLAVQREFIKWFPDSGWGNLEWSLEYVSNQYSLSITEHSTSDLNSEPNIIFGDQIKEEYVNRLKETLQEQQRGGFLITPALHSIAATRFMKLAGRGVWDAATFVPANRSYFVETQKGYRALAEDPDPIAARFAIAFADSMNRDIPKSRVPRFLGGNLVYHQDSPSIEFRDGRTLPLSLLSSGSKEVLSIVSVLDMYEFRRRSSGPNLSGQVLYGDKLYVLDELTIEEPEASIFPRTQYELVQDIVALSNEADFNPYFTITTHSPYILSSFNNLLEAWQTGHMDEQRAEAVRAVIDEKYWVNPDEFRAYAIKDGVLTSIVAADTRLISENYLDSVSETIGAEFDELLRIGYVEA